MNPFLDEYLLDGTAYRLGIAFADVPTEKLQLAVIQMGYLAKGEKDAVAVTKLLQLDINIPFKPPLFSDKEGNDKYWPQVRTWAARQLGLESKEKKCVTCGAHAGFTYDKTKDIVFCNACGALRSR